ncbi:MAG: hypothetical protein IPN46_12665 [Saprospiraceae bacterium]|nr:hypothetical protein [Saprospiraceae bacterium]
MLSVPLGLPSPSQSAASQVALGTSIYGIVITRSLVSVLSVVVNGLPSVPLISSALVTPSPSQSPVEVAVNVTS